MSLHIETGHPVTADVDRLEAKTVRFVTDGGRTMFEVSAGKNGRSIEVRAVETTRVDGVIYDNQLDIRPLAANGVTVCVRPYDQKE